MKIVYVTGCLGFIGSYVTRKCLERGWKVYGVDKCTYVSNTSLIKEFEKNKNFKFEKIDIKDMKHLYDCDYVIYMAAESHVGNSIVSSREFIDSNVEGVRNLLELIRTKQINAGGRPFLFHFSTDEVYGDILKGEHNEEDMLMPSNPYSAAKAAGDMLILAWARTYNLDYVIFRPTNNYGIGQYPEKLIPITIKSFNRGQKVKLHNMGEPVRNWLHAEDTANAVMTILDSGVKNEVYNVAGGFEQKNIETVEKIIKLYYNVEDGWEEYIDFSYVREGQDVRYAINDDKLRSLGWKPQKSFDEELPKIVEYYKNKFIW